MNILLDAYFDQNFGDDLFVDTITKLYPEYKFYAFMEYYPMEVQKWAEKIPNLYILPDSAVLLRKGFFDAYICVGGDIFPEGGDFSKRQSWVTAVREAAGKVFFLGFSLFQNYGENTQWEIVRLMCGADVIAPRDEASANLLRNWMPEKEITVMADLGFLAKWPENKPAEHREINCLGIAVRRPGYADKDTMETYESDLAGLINAFLAENNGRKAIILALSNGSVKDKDVALAILEKIEESTRVEIHTYSGDLESTQQELAKCDFVICTRFHALIACIAMQIPFCPVNYEVKMENLLQEIAYRSFKYRFGETGQLKEEWNAVIGQAETAWAWDRERIIQYLAKGKEIIGKVRAILAAPDTKPFIKKDTSGVKCEEKEIIQECQKTISEYLKTIEECQNVNANYFRQIEELNTTKIREEEMLQEQILANNREKETLQEQIAAKIRDEEMLREQIAAQTAEFTKAAEENAAMQETLRQEKRELEEKLQESLDEKQKILECMRPFFIESRRNRLARKIAISKKGEKESLESNWNTLRQYFN